MSAMGEVMSYCPEWISNLSHFKAVHDIPSVEECQWFCNQIYAHSCTWFSYNVKTSHCKLFSGTMTDYKKQPNQVVHTAQTAYSEQSSPLDAGPDEECHVRYQQCVFIRLINIRFHRLSYHTIIFF